MGISIAPESPIAVIGAGTMGAGIAQVAATAGHPVFLFDSVEGAVDVALSDLRARLDRSVARGRRTRDDADAVLNLIVGCSWLAECAPASLIIEAIIEDLDIKRTVLREVESLVSPDAIIATNTSSLSVTAIAAELEHPGRFLGMHFFNPAPAMPLVEIVSGAATDAVVADTAAATVQVWGKEPVHCASTPGFIVNRVARPFYGEALRMAAEGVADYVTIDAVATECGGFRMGPFALMDLVGLDVNLAVSKSVFAQSFHDTRFAPHVLQQSLVDAGRLGRKAGNGFYEYGDASPDLVPQSVGAKPKPDVVEVHGDLGWAAGLVPRLEAAGVHVLVGSTTGLGHFVVDGVYLVPTDGRTATQLAADRVLPSYDVAVFDLPHSWAEVGRTAVAVADQARAETIDNAAGLFQSIGVAVSAIDDSPGLIVMRTVVQLAAVAVDAAAAGVAEAADIDTAMKLGTNYPTGPVEWADRIGTSTVANVLQNLRMAYGEDRYRVPAFMSRRALTGTPLLEVSANA